jgi:hypothetical protein
VYQVIVLAHRCQTAYEHKSSELHVHIYVPELADDKVLPESVRHGEGKEHVLVNPLAFQTHVNGF